MIERTIIHPYDQGFFMIKANTWEEVKQLWEGMEMEDKGSIDYIEPYFSVSDGLAAQISNSRGVLDVVFMYNESAFNQSAGERERSSYLANIIAHEAYHCVNYIFSRIRAEHDLNNDEPAAYLLGHIVGLITDFLNDD